MGEIILKNFTEELVRIWDPLLIIFYFVGFVLAAVGVSSMIRVADPMSGRHGSVSNGFWTLLVGVTLLNMPGFMDAGAWTLFRQESLGMLEGVQEGSGAWVVYLRFAIAAIQVAGLVAQFRGLLALTDPVGGRGEKLAGMWRIAGGIIAVNFPVFLRMLGSTAGGVVDNSISQFF